MKTTTQRGYDGAHKKRRQAALHNLTQGTPCEWCRLPMHRQKLHADHPTSGKHGITHYLITHAALDGRNLPDMPMENPHGLLDEHDLEP